MTWDFKSVLLALGLLVLVVAGVIMLVGDLAPERGTTSAGGRLPQPDSGTPPPAIEPSPEVARGVAALDAGQVSEAIEILEPIGPEDPSYSLALHTLGVAHERMGAPERSLDAFARLAELQPDNPNPWVSLAWAHHALGQDERAELAALRALEAAPGRPDLRFHVALFRVAQDKVAQAIPVYHRAMRADRDRAYVLQAESDLRELQRRRPELAGTHYALAFFANSLGGRAEEVHALERYGAVAPEGDVADVATARLAEARSALGLRDGAEETGAP